MSTASLTLAAASASSSSASSAPTQYRPVGIALAIGSGVLIGSSFVFKKRGLLSSQAGHEAGEGVAYLKSPLWWTGMTIMILGELCNFGAYAFVEAILVTPLGALSVVICAILSHFFLKEDLTLFGWIGCAQCILGAVIIALNGPQQQSVTTIAAFKKLFLAPGFLSFGAVVIAAALCIIFFIAPKYGKKSMLWYIMVCSLIGGLSVSCTQGLGACIVTTIRGDNQFKNWFIYFLLVFVTITLLTEIYYLNVALALFNTAMVTPTYYVLFTFCTLVTSVILYQGLKASGAQIMTIVLGFFVICTGIFILQLSKVDPRNLSKLDRKTTILLQATREEVQNSPTDVEGLPTGDSEKLEEHLEKTEEPSMDALRPGFGTVGTLVRARRRMMIRRNSNASRARDSASLHSHTGTTSVTAGDEPTVHQLLAANGSALRAPMERARTSSIRFRDEKKREEERLENTKAPTGLSVGSETLVKPPLDVTDLPSHPTTPVREDTEPEHRRTQHGHLSSSHPPDLPSPQEEDEEGYVSREGTGQSTTK